MSEKYGFDFQKGQPIDNGRMSWLDSHDSARNPVTEPTLPTVRNGVTSKAVEASMRISNMTTALDTSVASTVLMSARYKGEPLSPADLLKIRESVP